MVLMDIDGQIMKRYLKISSSPARSSLFAALLRVAAALSLAPPLFFFLLFGIVAAYEEQRQGIGADVQQTMRNVLRVIRSRGRWSQVEEFDESA